MKKSFFSAILLIFAVLTAMPVCTKAQTAATTEYSTNKTLSTEDYARQNRWRQNFYISAGVSMNCLISAPDFHANPNTFTADLAIGYKYKRQRFEMLSSCGHLLNNKMCLTSAVRAYFDVDFAKCLYASFGAEAGITLWSSELYPFAGACFDLGCHIFPHLAIQFGLNMRGLNFQMFQLNPTLAFVVKI